MLHFVVYLFLEIGERLVSTRIRALPVGSGPVRVDAHYLPSTLIVRATLGDHGLLFKRHTQNSVGACQHF